MLFIIMIVSLICIVINYWVRNYLFSPMEKPLPGPIRLPFIGSTYYFLQRKPEDFFNVLTKYAETYSSPFQLWIGSNLLIVLHEPDQIKTVLQSRHCLNKSLPYKIIEPTFGTGLLTAPASIWIENRKMISPTFNTIMLQNFFNIFAQEALIFAEDLEKIGQNGNKIIFLDHLQKYTLRTSFDILMGVKLEKNIIDQWLKASKRISKIWQYRFRTMFLIPDIIFNLTSTGREQRKNLNFFHLIIDKIIQQKTNESSTTANGDVIYKRFLDIFMDKSCNEKFTRKEIIDNVITLISTSSDSISITMNFVIFMLANFSEIQEKVYKELLEIYGTETPKSAPVKHEDLQHMHYLDCVIKETLRLFPTVPVIGRHVEENLKIGEFILPKSTDILVSFIQMHRNEKYWPNPLVFDPNRFLEKSKNLSYYYMPFSDGPRNCIGLKYAMLSMKITLATLIRTFVFKVNQSIEIDKIKLNMNLILSTVEPLKIKIEKRNL